MGAQRRFAQFVLLSAIFAWLSAFNRAEAGVITWSGNTWNHTAFGGNAANVGWQTGMQGGTTTDTSGVSLTVQHQRFGTAAASTNNMSLQPGNGSNLLYWSATGDYDTNVGAPSNYGTVTLTFSSAVTVTNFGLRDVDDGTGTSWQDFISVRALNGASSVGVTYNRADTTNQQLSTQHGMSGVLGINNINKTDADDTGNVGFTFAGAVTSLQITFLDGPGGASAVQHHIMLQNLTITPVPEASSLVLGGLALGLFGASRRLHSRRTN